MIAEIYLGSKPVACASVSPHCLVLKVGWKRFSVETKAAPIAALRATFTWKPC